MKKTLYVEGIHCASCEILLTKELNDIKWIKVLSVSYKTWKIVFDWKDKTLNKKAFEIIKKSGYNIKDKIDVIKKEGKDKINWFLILWILFVSWLIMLFLSQLNVYQYLPNTDEISIGIALLMWLIASISTCLAVTGSVVLWFWKYIDDSKRMLWHLRVQWSFHIWRILWFFFLWWVLWLIGQVFKLSFWANAVVTIIIGLVLAYMWLHMLEVLPSITKLWFHMPKKLSKGVFNIKNPVFAPIVWALTFFLPCWFTQSMQLVAIWSGDFWQGGFVMAMFAIWTMPVLLVIWLGWSYISWNKFKILNQFVWALILFFWLFSISNGWTLIWNNSSRNLDFDKDVMASQATYENIEVGHNGWSLEPKQVELDYGKNYKLVIIPNSNGIGCMSTMIIPKVSRDVHRIIKGQPIIYELVWLKKWKYPVVCASMGMYQWELIVK